MTEQFVLCEHLTGIQVYAWMTQSMFYEAEDSWSETRIDAYEDRDGQIIPHDVLLSDLEILFDHPDNSYIKS